MNASTVASNVSSEADTDCLSHMGNISADNTSASQLPRPLSSQPDIADSGRISFGAAARLPVRK